MLNSKGCTPNFSTSQDCPLQARIKVADEFRDEGVSGTKDLDDREGLGDLMARVRSNGVRLVLVERADRLARDLMVSEVLLTEFRKLDVQVIAADSGTDLTAGDDDPTRVRFLISDSKDRVLGVWNPTSSQFRF
jgi:DNA invertase Pin-like site-specific DNA recombinase